MLSNVAWTWPWQTRRGERPSAFFAELEEVEQDCMRRLDWVDAQVARALRRRSHWSAAMTVADADIMPVGRATRVMTAVRSMRDRRWILVTGALVVIIVAVTFVTCGTPAEMP